MEVGMVGLAWRELISRRRTTAGLMLGVGVVLLVYFSIEGLWAGVARTLSAQESEALVVLPKDAMALSGNRLPVSMRSTLRGLGAEAGAPQPLAGPQASPGKTRPRAGGPV